ncbi:MAG: polysaccharide deacetylase family protein [Gammaproteobacteria bacterium]|nr:polysaccharide deacetylase family protein [Gammaproteobacteria bacterium]
MKKISFFVGSLSYSVRRGIHAIHVAYPNAQILIVHQSSKKSVPQLLKSQWRNMLKNGWRWIPYQVENISTKLLQKYPSKFTTSPKTPGLQYSWERIKSTPNIQYISCRDIHSKEVLRKVQSFKPTLGISLSSPILKVSIFAIPTLGTINLHKGKVPYYRGMPPAFWELWNNEKEVGCTIHKIEKGLDTGDILLESVMPISKYSTVKGLQIQLDELGVSMLEEAVGLISAGRDVWPPQQKGGQTYFKPTLKQKNTLEKKLPTKNNSPFFRYFAKQGLFTLHIHVFSLLRKKLTLMNQKQKVVVLLYHRVDDNFRDSVTVGVGQFDRQMEIIKRCYPVISIEDIINDNLPGYTSQPLVAVTFDDGYLDNYKNAMPILLKHQIPAAFFVSTGIVGTDNGFAHDIEKINRALPNMTWEQVEQMHQLDFTIGSHTVSHINCAKDDKDLVIAELIKSKEDLEDRLSLSEMIFAYPFGKKNDITPDILEEVKKQGYTGCLSAYGGINQVKVDPYNVLRVGIDYNFTDKAFRAKIEGL